LTPTRLTGEASDMASTRVQVAELAGVSRQAIHQALRRGWLIAEPDGGIDPDREPNATYLSQHRRGFDSRTRPMVTHRGSEPRQVGAPFDVGQFLAALGDRQVDPCAADYLLSGLIGTSEEALRVTAALLAGLPTELAELRASIAELRALAREAGR
jgi:hypothetical protein